jgi:hypothetical protein
LYESGRLITLLAGNVGVATNQLLGSGAYHTEAVAVAEAAAKQPFI